MELFDNIADLRASLGHARRFGVPIAFVPTMGYLHKGHATLVSRAAELAGPDGRVVVSIFVNPLQFGPSEDFECYPRDLDRDRAIASEAGATDIYYPSVAELTPADLVVKVEPGVLATRMCGASRPGHFAGVTTIVSKLFNIVQPDVAVFGWKDAQQLLIIRKMVRDLNFPVEVVGVETVREPDGLAMSSRNVYLSPDDRAQAVWISRALQTVREAVVGGETSASALKRLVREIIEKETSARIDYVEIARMSDLGEPEVVEAGNTLLAVAAYFGKTRLIDNARF